MRKIIMALALGLIFALAACGGSDNGAGALEEEYQAAVDAIVQDTATEIDEPAFTDEAEDIEEPLAAQSNDGFAFTADGFVIHMDMDMSLVLDALGQPLGVFEAPSCAFDGIDRIFRFPGVQIHTYPEGDLDFVHTISIRDDSVTTTEGIYLGSDFEAVIAAYGSNYEQEFGMFTFTRGETTLSFFVEDDMVVGITYGLIMD